MKFKVVPEDIKAESSEWLQKLIDDEIEDQGLTLSVEVEVMDEGSVTLWIDDGSFVMFCYDCSHNCIQPIFDHENLETRILVSTILVDEKNIYHPLFRNIRDTME